MFFGMNHGPLAWSPARPSSSRRHLACLFCGGSGRAESKEGLASSLAPAPGRQPLPTTRQFNGTAMLRPAASPWTSLSHTWPAVVRTRPIAARCINIFATSSSAEPALQQAVNVEGTATPMHTPENTLSTLSFLEPFRRAPVGIPFLYQKVSSTSPVTALISTKAPISSIVSVNLDGRDDWIISQRNALLAWTGHTLSLKPQYNVKLGLANWGNTYITGRGLLALAGSGQIYQVHVKAGETYVAHPSNVVAYTASTTPPLPFRFKSSNVRFQVPNLGLGSLIESSRFFRTMSQTATWRTLATAFHTLKTWLRRTVWGDRLFLQFTGPATMLLQSRASRISDVLALRDVDEIAESPPGAVLDAVERKIKEEIKSIENEGTKAPIPNTNAEGTLRYATIKEGKAEFEKAAVGEKKPVV
ncbi:mitochondrial fmp26 [Pyrenophora seminiperda CCB06]|uniref:Altered inheritance of mitochondria protein 24, mitochondrial n=1 Tax=Pyrenophora seminiperda CCB06 TaxID=1302712 RepID=A0A3M7M4G1_9PLEO|nr:mitochondrial fmp26 [Pyrenophora seminiperda CCB06]